MSKRSGKQSGKQESLCNRADIDETNQIEITSAINSKTDNNDNVTLSTAELRKIIASEVQSAVMKSFKELQGQFVCRFEFLENRINDLQECLKSTNASLLNNLESCSSKYESDAAKRFEVIDKKLTNLLNNSIATTTANDEASIQAKTMLRRQAQECIRAATDATARTERASNVKVRGLTEVNTTNDENSFIEMCKDVFDITVTVNDLRRVGRVPPAGSTTAKPRPLIVKLTNAQQRNVLLQKSHLLKKTTRFCNVFIGPDLTRLQEEEAFELRKECRSRNADLSEDEHESNPFVVYKNRILRRSEIRKPSREIDI